MEGSSIDHSAWTSQGGSLSAVPIYRSETSSSRRESEHPGREQRRREGGSGGGGGREQGNPFQPRDGHAPDGYPPVGDTNSISARMIAQAAAPSLSATDIDRLAESIVARMTGRDRDLRGRSVEEGETVVSEEEPPPPWSAPMPSGPGMQ